MTSTHVVARQVVAFGCWPSPISPAMVSGGVRRFGLVKADGDWVYWSEGRPDAQGKAALMRARAASPSVASSGDGIDEPQELVGPPFSVRSQVHEYGGGEFTVSDGKVWFVNQADQQIYALLPGSAPQRLTNRPEMRFADICHDPLRNRLIAIAERRILHDAHEHALPQNLPENLIVTIDLNAESLGQVGDLVTGRDFYAYPCISPDAAGFAFIAWDLPGMPWDNAALYIAPFEIDGRPGPLERLAGGDGNAAGQPIFADDGSLYFLCDENGWDNIYCYRDGVVAPFRDDHRDFGRPLWGLGTRSFAPLANGDLLAVPLKDGEAEVERIDGLSGRATGYSLPLRELDGLAAAGDGVAGLASFDERPAAVVHIRRPCGFQILRTAADWSLEEADISVGFHIAFPGAAGATAHGVGYPPASSTVTGPAEAKPPAIVMVHGGPTGRTDRGFKPKIQYWTSRGFFVLDVDYSGSTGYGRAYRERLDGAWGVRDTEDVVAAARHLAAAGLADARKIAISGGSSGGYTVLMALATADVFAAGTASYPVTDLEQLLAITHKFESGYLYRLTGTKPDNWREIFAARSPLRLAGQIERPVLILQGADDKVVPPAQADIMVQRLRETGVSVEYRLFEGEGHGFRQAASIEEALQLEHQFLIRSLSLGPTA